MIRRASLCLLATALLPLGSACADSDNSQRSKIERGKYLVKIAGCNDCHTPGYGLSNGKAPESTWLIGDPTGWKGPWGTTYAINLRQQVSAMSEDDWVKMVRVAQARPPMPWYVLHEMDEADVRAMYAFIRTLGPSDNKVPVALAPGQEAPPPLFELRLPQAPAQAGEPK